MLASKKALKWFGGPAETLSFTGDADFSFPSAPTAPDDDLIHVRRSSGVTQPCRAVFPGRRPQLLPHRRGLLASLRVAGMRNSDPMILSILFLVGSIVAFIDSDLALSLILLWMLIPGATAALHASMAQDRKSWPSSTLSGSSNENINAL